MLPSQNELPQETSLKDLEHGARTFEIEATASQRAAIADRFSLHALTSLTGTITLEIPAHRHPMFDETIVISEGVLKAIYEQICVVSLEPFEISLETSFGGVFANHDPAENLAEDDDEGRADLPDVLGPINDGVIPIGEAFVEQFALEIDPFPRKPGVEFDGLTLGSTSSDDTEPKSPFAVLAKLKDNLE